MKKTFVTCDGVIRRICDVIKALNIQIVEYSFLFTLVQKL